MTRIVLHIAHEQEAVCCLCPALFIVVTSYHDLENERCEKETVQADVELQLVDELLVLDSDDELGTSGCYNCCKWEQEAFKERATEDRQNSIKQQ